MQTFSTKANFSIPIFLIHVYFQGMKKLAILGSGSGSNMQAISDAIANNSLKAEIVYVGSDNPQAYILERAKAINVEPEILDCARFKNKFPAEAQSQLAKKLLNLEIDLLCLAGFMRLVKKPLLEAFPNKILNIHPSLLPKYPGLAAWEQAVTDGASESGCTVHYVDSGMDTGEIIAQAVVPIHSDDTSLTLHQRIQDQERVLYPEVIAKIITEL